MSLKDKIADWMEKTYQSPLLITRIRQSGSRWIGTIALWLLALSVLLFIWMWVKAYIQGEIPQTPWGKYEGNHGPWHYRYYILGPFAPKYDLQWIWSQVLNLQVFSFIFGLVSIVFKPSRRNTIITALAFVSGLLFFITHYWLVD